MHTKKLFFLNALSLSRVSIISSNLIGASLGRLQQLIPVSWTVRQALKDDSSLVRASTLYAQPVLLAEVLTEVLQEVHREVKTGVVWF